ncbi:phage tail assembly protein T [Serratia fonticola]|uniref:phage tail assembly protein T n=1 Tax=Serratia fonticola TaxID=47917 RepID=UPI003F5F11FD
MSLREFWVWVKYRAKYGGLNPMMRTEWAAALVSSTIANVNRGKDTPAFRITDFAPHIDEKPISLDEAMESWT